MLEAEFRDGATVADVVRSASLTLRSARVECAERDARILVARAAGLSSLEILKDPDRVLSTAAAELALQFLGRRLSGEPVSRILGEREFYGRPFKVTPATLDPRPDTETVINAVLEMAHADGGPNRPLRILDVGTGTGCIGLTLLAELPNAQALLTDISQPALDVARENAERLGVGARANLQLAKSLDGVNGVFDVVVSNPPYIPTSEIGSLQLEVRDHDPHRALDGGADGLDVYREIIGGLGAVLPKGRIFFEVGAGQAMDVAAYLQAARLGDLRFWSDLGGHVRCVAALTQF
jgi:release factor glutamine methyltransferase